MREFLASTDFAFLLSCILSYIMGFLQGVKGK